MAQHVLPLPLGCFCLAGVVPTSCTDRSCFNSFIVIKLMKVHLKMESICNVTDPHSVVMVLKQ